MTKEEKIDTYSMKLDGYTYKEIADKHGCSVAQIQKIIPNVPYERPLRPQKISDLCAYEGLANYIQENKSSTSKIAQYIGLSNNNVYVKLVGKREFRINEIRKMLELTGMTFEECFALKEREDNKNE